jgi:hypothetical protein
MGDLAGDASANGDAGFGDALEEQAHWWCGQNGAWAGRVPARFIWRSP